MTVLREISSIGLLHVEGLEPEPVGFYLRVTRRGGLIGGEGSIDGSPDAAEAAFHKGEATLSSDDGLLCTIQITRIGAAGIRFVTSGEIRGL